jgi:hypothetical protein
MLIMVGHREIGQVWHGLMKGFLAGLEWEESREGHRVQTEKPETGVMVDGSKPLTISIPNCNSMCPWPNGRAHGN